MHQSETSNGRSVPSNWPRVQQSSIVAPDQPHSAKKRTHQSPSEPHRSSASAPGAQTHTLLPLFLSLSIYLALSRTD
ncbi:hypothetical protein Mapa_015484 [Marchantia paleacea]|nr:hypothetical protein Mapa_015484 [Marchantia paleacea]